MTLETTVTRFAVVLAELAGYANRLELCAAAAAGKITCSFRARARPPIVDLHPAGAGAMVGHPWLGTLMICIGTLAIGCSSGSSTGFTGTPTFDLTGSWSGTWSSGVTAAGGTVVGQFYQAGTSLSGTANMGGSPCFFAIALNGGYTAERQFRFSVGSASEHIELEGSVLANGTQIGGTYVIFGGVCNGDTGSWAMGLVGSGFSGTPTFDLTGGWSGFWASGVASAGGTVVAQLQQTGVKLSGNASIAGSGCFSGLSISGAYTSETDFRLAAVSTGQRIEFEGSVGAMGTQVGGTYVTFGGACDGDTGSWAMGLTSPVTVPGGGTIVLIRDDGTVTFLDPGHDAAGATDLHEQPARTILVR